MSPTEQPSLEDRPAQCWALLSAGAGAPGNALYTGVLATVSGDGPTARTVVLRHASAPDRALWFHTDRRSAKVAELSRDPRISWVFWDPETRIQLRCRGRAREEMDQEQIQAQWARLSDHARSLYVSVDPDDLRRDRARGHFLCYRCVISAIDWLHLDRAGHQRARLDWAQGRWQTRRIAP